MSDLLTKLADIQANKQQTAKTRREQADQDRQQQRDLDAAWNRAIRVCNSRVSGKAVQDLLELGRLLRAAGYHAYLPSIIATRQKAVESGHHDGPAELYVAELLRLASDAKPKPRTISKHLDAAGELWPDGFGFPVGAIRDYLELRHKHGGTLPEPPPEQQPRKKSSAKPPAKPDQEGPWSKPDGPRQWARVFGFSVDTLMRRFADGTIRHKKYSPKSYAIHVADLPKAATSASSSPQ
jgi:hypothetical protein